MDEIIIESHGKINLGLDILFKREDGYHEINTVMQQIDLADKLIFREKEDGIIISSQNKEIPLDSNNLIYKAWERLCEKTGIKRGIHIELEKNIPVAAGLAGGSANAATTLKGLNQLWDLNLSEEELRNIGKEIGADIPFCIMGGTALAQGIGEILTPIKPFKGKNILLANFGVGVSTVYAYSILSLENKRKIDIKSLIASIEADDIEAVAKNLGNIMEDSIVKEHPIILDIKKDMIKYGALGSLMSGSGPTVFGIFEDEEKLDYCKDKLSNKIEKLYKCKTI